MSGNFDETRDKASFERIRAWSSNWSAGKPGHDSHCNLTNHKTGEHKSKAAELCTAVQQSLLHCILSADITSNNIWILVPVLETSQHSLLVTDIAISVFESCFECRWIKNLKPISRRPLEGQELTANEQNKLRKYLSRVSCRILNNKQTTMRTWIKLLGILKLCFYLGTTKGLIS